MTMKALTQAARAICLVTAKETDVARRAKDPAERAAAANRVALLTPDRQGLLHRHRLRGGLDRRAGARRHGLHRGDRRGAASIATRASCRSTKAPTASRPSTSSRASCRWKAARWSRATSRELKQTADEVRASNRPEFGRMGERLGEAVAALAEATPLDGRRAAARTRRRRWRAPRPICACSASPPAASTSPRARWRRARNGATRPAQPIALARFFAENTRHRRAGPEGDRHRRRRLHAGARGAVCVTRGRHPDRRARRPYVRQQQRGRQ